MNTGNIADEPAQHHDKDKVNPTAEMPLAGVVVCCTSVAPEVRSQLADCAHQMGAEHKLDLTSDVTHLLVGDADTLKYKYVAREREDIQVLRPDWVEAVRSRWMNAKPIDLNALAVEYRLPIFFGLKICITGFDDLAFRSRMQENVTENGGEYTGDLTKDVTHLIAARAEGKKYEYGTQWQKKVVSLKWYKDTLSRGMQLDESLYHPSKPIDEQGIGAWNRLQPPAKLRKRIREEIAGLEPPRKLRRTASARLGSQTDNLWTDIVGGGFETSEVEQPLRPSKSMPIIENRHVRPDPDAHFDEKPNTLSISSGYLDEKYFVIHGFDQKRQVKLRQILLDLGGAVLDTMQQLADTISSDSVVKIVIVPYETPSERIAAHLDTIESVFVVSELWLEHCMSRKCYVPPDDYPLSSLISRTKPAGFSRLRLNATGFNGIQVLHISKMVRLLGGQYEERFTSNISALICNQGGDSSQKLSHASLWQIPAVSESWLTTCLRENRTASFEKHLVQPLRQKESDVSNHSKHGQGTKQNAIESQNSLQDKHRPGFDFLLYEDSASGLLPIPTEVRRDPNKSKDDESVGSAKEPLREISPNSPKKQMPLVSQLKPKKRLFRTLGGPSSLPEVTSANENTDSTKPDAKSERLPPGPKTHSIAGEIQDFYSMRANAKLSRCSVPEGASTKTRLQGRALSNLSNGSLASAARRSRASSVDSINTDGVGSEIAPITSTIRKSQDLGDDRSLTGRAKSQLFEGSCQPLEFAGPGLYTSEIEAEEAAPPMTQLLYDDSEDTIALREKLAAKRRQRSRLGQKDDDPKPGVLKEPRRIRDDAIVATNGWGAGRRTRHKDKSPPGLKGF